MAQAHARILTVFMTNQISAAHGSAVGYSSPELSAGQTIQILEGGVLQDTGSGCNDLGSKGS
jgi:hypothetical protein